MIKVVSSGARAVSAGILCVVVLITNIHSNTLTVSQAAGGIVYSIGISDYN